MKLGAVSFRWKVCGALVGVAAILVGVGMVVAADWSQFQGPNSDGTSPEKGLAKAWPAAGPKELWKVPLGPGYGNAAVRAGKVYILDRVDQKDVLRCLDLATGKAEWTFGYDAPGEVQHDGSRSTPAVSDKYVYTIGSFGQLTCVDLATHQAVWKKNLLTDFGAKLPRWAVAQSPILYKDVVVAAPQGERAGVVAFEPATGKVRWESAAIGAMDYTSPRLVTLDSVDQFILVNQAGAASVAAADGKVLWKYAHPYKIAIPNVSVLSGNRLFVTGGYNMGSAVIQVSHDGNAWTAKELAKIDAAAGGGGGRGGIKAAPKAPAAPAAAPGKVDGMGSQVHPGLIVNDYIYVICNTNERDDGLVCLDAKLNVVWQTKKEPWLDKGGSVLTGDGLIYAMDGSTGELYIIEPSPAGFKPLGKAKVLAGKEIWAPLVLSDGKLLVRDQTQLKCLDVRGQ